MNRHLVLFSIALLILILPFEGHKVLAGLPQVTQSTGEIFATDTAVFTTPGTVNALASLDNGRMLVGGSFVTIGGQAAPYSLAIVKSDGSLDASFRVDTDLQVHQVNDVAVQSDGMIVIAGWFTRPPSPFTYYLLRLNTNGTVDETFSTFGINGQVYSVLVDGTKILIGGNFTTPTSRIARLDQNGTADPAFSGLGSGPDGSVRDIARQSSGKYVIVGEFSEVNSTSQVGVARLNSDGSLDAGFVPGGYRESKRVTVLNDDSVLVGGENICGDDLFNWYTSAGAVITGLTSDPDSFQEITAFLPLPDGGFLIGGWHSAVCINGSPTAHEGQIWRFASDGSHLAMTSFSSEADMLAMALRSDGMVVVGGQGLPETESAVGDFDGLRLLDLSSDGLEKEDAFHPVVGDEAEIYSLSQYSDGKLLVAGNFSHVDGSPRFGVARLMADGTLDTAFHPFDDQPGGWSKAAQALPDGRAVVGFGDSGLYLIGTDNSLTDLSALNDYDRVSALACQSDDKVLVGSDFGLGVRRFLADFSALDGAFVSGNAYGDVFDLAVQSDGKILVAGDFTQYNSENVPGLVRLTSAGSFDESFTPPAFDLDGYQAKLYSVTPVTGGDVLVGGDFDTVGGETHTALVRLNDDGTRDSGFTSPSGFSNVKSTCLQSDNSIWAGGVDDTYFSQPQVLYLNANGTPDNAFASEYVAAHDDGVVNILLCNASSLAWSGGLFSQIDSRPFYGLAKYLALENQVFMPMNVR